MRVTSDYDFASGTGNERAGTPAPIMDNHRGNNQTVSQVHQQQDQLTGGQQNYPTEE